eukprot:6206069-Pleurochrysis_carterae.AAC.2
MLLATSIPACLFRCAFAKASNRGLQIKFCCDLAYYHGLVHASILAQEQSKHMRFRRLNVQTQTHPLKPEGRLKHAEITRKRWRVRSSFRFFRVVFFSSDEMIDLTPSAQC